MLLSIVRWLEQKAKLDNTSRWIFRFMATEKKGLSVGLATTIIAALAGILVPYITGLTIDTVLEGLSSGQTSSLVSLVSLLLLTGVVNYLLYASAIILTERYTGLVTKRLRRELFAKLQTQSHQFYDSNPTGDLVSRTTDDILALWETFFVLPFDGTNAFVYTVGIVGMLAIISPPLALVCLMALPIMWLVIRHFQNKFQPQIFDARKEYGFVNKVLQENIAGATVVKAFAGEEKEKAKFDQRNAAYRDKMFSALRIRGALWPQLGVLAGFVSVLVLIIASFQVMAGSLTPGLLVSAVLFATKLARPVDHLSGAVFWWSRGKTVGGRIFEILEAEPTISDLPDALSIPNQLTGAVHFNAVSFRYQDQVVLDNISLRVQPGEIVALLGPTGSGKTTLVNLVARFYDPSEGSVMVDGTDIRCYKRESLREQVSFVEQESFLFSHTVHENIAFGHPDASRAEVEWAAKIANAHDFIVDLEKGYDTVIGERGITLSGGQRQRIAIARALLANPRILILDDSLSAVDPITEQSIHRSLERVLPGRTVFVITQRLNTTSIADRILVLDRGKVVEQGTHDELMVRNGLYKQLYDTQKEGLVDYTVISQEVTSVG